MRLRITETPDIYGFLTDDEIEAEKQRRADFYANELENVLQLPRDKQEYIAKNTDNQEIIYGLITQTDDSFIIKSAALENPNISHETYKKVVDAKVEKAIEYFSQRKDLPLDISIDIIKIGETSRTYSGAQNICYIAQNTPHKEAMEYIMNMDKNAYFLDNLAANPNMSPDMYKILSRSPNAEVRRSVAWNENTPEKILMRLAYDIATSVRLGVARNTNVPNEVLQILLYDSSSDVAKEANERLRVRDYRIDTKCPVRFSDFEDSYYVPIMYKDGNKLFLAPISKIEDGYVYVQRGYIGGLDGYGNYTLDVDINCKAFPERYEFDDENDYLSWLSGSFDDRTYAMFKYAYNSYKHPRCIGFNAADLKKIAVGKP